MKTRQERIDFWAGCALIALSDNVINEGVDAEYAFNHAEALEAERERRYGGDRKQVDQNTAARMIRDVVAKHYGSAPPDIDGYLTKLTETIAHDLAGIEILK